MEPTPVRYPWYGNRRPYQLSHSGLALSTMFAIIFYLFQTFLEIIETGFGNPDRFCGFEPKWKHFGKHLSAWDQFSQLGTRPFSHSFTSRNLSIYLTFNFKLWNRFGILDRLILQHTFHHMVWIWLVHIVVMNTSVSSNPSGCIYIPESTAQCANKLYYFTPQVLFPRRGTRQVFLTRHPSHVIGRPPTYLRCRT